MNLKLTNFLRRPQPIRGNRRPISEGERTEAEKEHCLGVVSSLHSRGDIFHSTRALLLIALLLASLLFPLIGCSSNDEIAREKLASPLEKLIDAEKRGEAESFAQLHKIDLVDGSVKVVITCEPGQCETASKAISRVGVVTDEDFRWEEIVALVPITRLIGLAGKVSIRKIGLPVKPVPEVGQEPSKE